MAETLEHRQRDAAHAGVDVAVDVARRRQRGDLAPIGSITPCGYAGAEPTSSTVFGVIAAAIAAASALKSAPTGTRTERTSKYAAPFSNAACALVGQHHLRRA